MRLMSTKKIQLKRSDKMSSMKKHLLKLMKLNTKLRLLRQKKLPLK